MFSRARIRKLPLFGQPLGRAAGKVVLPVVVALILVLALLLRLGLGVQELLQDEAPVASTATDPSAMAASVDIAAIQSLQLFSEPSAPATVTNSQPALNVRETALNLQLEGVMLSSTPQQSVAVIVSQAQQRSYKVGDSLPGASGLSLQAVAVDHVIINNRGSEEILWLHSAKMAATQAQSGATGQTTLAPATASVLDSARKNGAAMAAASLAEIMEVSPAQANGQLIGYRLDPGIKLKEFVQLGFRAGDVVTQVNGLALNDMSKLPELYSLMNEATEVSFSLLRDGQPLTLNITLQPPVKTASNQAN